MSAMEPIAIIGKEWFEEPENFINYLIEFCEKRKDQKRALVFAFIVYNLQDYTLFKILADKNYWTSLDVISGEYISIFYIDSHESYFNQRKKEIDEDLDFDENELKSIGKDLEKKGDKHVNEAVDEILNLKSTIKKLEKGIVERSLKDHERSIKYLKDQFSIQQEINTPFIIFFQTNEDEIIDFFIVKLKMEKIEESFIELKKHIQNAVNSIKNVTDENIDNSKEIFSLVKNTYHNSSKANFIKNKIINKISLGNMIMFVKMLFGLPS